MEILRRTLKWAPLVTERTQRGRMDTTWMHQGKCRELRPETFFPSDGVGVEVARKICADCPVKEPCLEYALYNRIEHGVWGGASERERRRIARRRRGAHVTATTLSEAGDATANRP